MRKPLLTLTKKDFRVDTFRAGGKGGQHQNKTDSGVRITHIETGISSESRVHREQHRNKKEAFQKLCGSYKFRIWLKNKSLGIAEIEDKVEEAMRFENLKIEVKKDGKWVEE